MRLPTLPREAGLWVGAACAGLAGGLAYKHWATKKYGGEANRLVAEAKRAAVAGDASTACARYEECLELVRARGGAHQRFGEATATLARAAANACEDAGACSALVQKRLVLEHSKLLQLSLKTAKDLQMWCAPGNTEMKVGQKLESLRPLDGIKGTRDALPMDVCGFEPEQYKKANGEVEQGFYVRLDDNGQPKGESHVKVVPPEKLEEMRATGMLTG